MPELPDVEGFRQTFARYATAKQLRAVRWIDSSMLRDTTPRALARGLSGARFSDPERQGKLLICFTQGSATLMLHFGLSGSSGHTRARWDLLTTARSLRSERDG